MRYYCTGSIFIHQKQVKKQLMSVTTSVNKIFYDSAVETSHSSVLILIKVDPGYI